MSLTFEYFASDMNKQYTYKQKIHAEKNNKQRECNRNVKADLNTKM